MKKKPAPGTPVDLQTRKLEKRLLSSSIRLEAMIQLLIENGFFSKESFDAKVRELSRIITDKRQKTVPPDGAETRLEPQPQTEWDIDTPEIVKSRIIKVLPEELMLIDNHLICHDPQSANAICAPCIAQNTMMIESVGVKDICGIPELITRKKKDRNELLQGVHRRCWMYDIADKILEAREQNLIPSEIIFTLMIKTIEQVITAIEQKIAPEGIGSIIDCVLLEAQTEEAEKTLADTGQQINGGNIYDDINWQH